MAEGVLPWLFRSRRQRLLRPRRQRLLRHRRQRLLRPRCLVLLRGLPTTWLRQWRRPLREWRRLPAGWKPPSRKAKAKAVAGMPGMTKNARGLRCTAQGDCLRAQHRPRCVNTATGTNQANIAAKMRAARVARSGLVAHAYTTTLGEAGGCFGPWAASAPACEFVFNQTPKHMMRHAWKNQLSQRRRRQRQRQRHGTTTTTTTTTILLLLLLLLLLYYY